MSSFDEHPTVFHGIKRELSCYVQHLNPQGDNVYAVFEYGLTRYASISGALYRSVMISMNHVDNLMQIKLSNNCCLFLMYGRISLTE